jgi:drug/metabolite transporter (DMT)-like permease
MAISWLARQARNDVFEAAPILAARHGLRKPLQKQCSDLSAAPGTSEEPLPKLPKLVTIPTPQTRWDLNTAAQVQEMENSGESSLPDSRSPVEESDRRGLLTLHLALLAVQASFSGLHVVGKMVLDDVPPLALACLRVLFATPVLLLIAARRGAKVPELRWLPKLALLGFLGVFLNQVLFIVGLSYTTPTNAAILMTSVPAFAVGVAALLGLERIGPYRLAGVILAICGALVILDPTRFSLGESTLLGNLLILLNCLSFATFLVLQRPILRHLPWQTVIAGAFVFGSLGVLAVGGTTLGQLSASSLAASTWMGILYIMVFPTTLSYLINSWAIQRSSALLAAAYTTLQPLLTALLSRLFLAEVLTWRQALGFALIASGLWFVSWRAGRGTARASTPASRS